MLRISLTWKGGGGGGGGGGASSPLAPPGSDLDVYIHSFFHSWGCWVPGYYFHVRMCMGSSSSLNYERINLVRNMNTATDVTNRLGCIYMHAFPVTHVEMNMQYFATAASLRLVTLMMTGVLHCMFERGR